jgi:hypothetical protein
LEVWFSDFFAEFAVEVRMLVTKMRISSSVFEEVNPRLPVFHV